jgi:LmbE family N-acetylglucosaminyl deacetylase
MITLLPHRLLGPADVVLVLSAHCDDAALGCGALMRRLRQEGPSGPELRAIVFSGGDDAVRSVEERRAADAFGITKLDLLSYPDSLLPNHWHEIKAHLLAVRQEIGSERIALILCPRIDDRHQDHRIVTENVWRVFRDHLILEYEVFKYEGDVGQPNVYIPLAESEAQAKLTALVNCYPSRRTHHWWNPDTLCAPMLLRGIECNEKYAEAFVARKLVWGSP